MLVECLPCCDGVSVPWVEVLEGGLQAGWRLRVAQWRREQVVVVVGAPHTDPSHRHTASAGSAGRPEDP